MRIELKFGPFSEDPKFGSKQLNESPIRVLVNSAKVRRVVRRMGGEWEAHRCETWEATMQISVKRRKSAGDGTPFLVMQAISKKRS
jgi:hypothetical protein